MNRSWLPLLDKETLRHLSHVVPDYGPKPLNPPSEIADEIVQILESGSVLSLGFFIKNYSRTENPMQRSTNVQGKDLAFAAKFCMESGISSNDVTKAMIVNASEFNVLQDDVLK